MFRFSCSVALRGGRGISGRYRWLVCGGPAVFRPHWVCPLSWLCALPVYTAQAPSCSVWSRPCIVCSSSFQVFHKSTDSVGPVFCAFASPSSSGSQELEGCTLPGCGVPSPSAAPASVSVHACRVRVPCVYSWELTSSRDPHGAC